ncbi:hypothetical protein B0T18DRAFT_115408 [Schizothecium vesticola]|uniref:Uncharacterized protein n=1 Tax=Schizothecium vesticola TaxID=314040 RepID=A0AA40F2N8_9PEZI|nr:hypothetical protein B0T18DRAFT_115408 [Schizothecium vesticola]
MHHHTTSVIGEGWIHSTPASVVSAPAQHPFGGSQANGFPFQSPMTSHHPMPLVGRGYSTQVSHPRFGYPPTPQAHSYGPYTHPAASQGFGYPTVPLPLPAGRMHPQRNIHTQGQGFQQGQPPWYQPGEFQEGPEWW